MDKFEYALKNIMDEIICMRQQIDTHKSLMEVELQNFSNGSGATLVFYSTQINEYLTRLKIAEEKMQLVKLLRDSE